METSRSTPMRSPVLFAKRRLLGESIGFWICLATGVAFAAVYPSLVSPYRLLSISGFMIPVFLALGLSLIWGQAGILSLGQSMFFGIGGYAFGIVGINFLEGQGNTDLALLVGIGAPVLAALAIGWVVFYGRVKSVLVAIILLIITLVLQTFMNQTASSVYRIGIAYLGGNNGLGRFSGEIREPPSLALGFGETVHTFNGQDQGFFYLLVALFVVIYLGLRWLKRSRWGYALAGIREDRDRTESFGHDVRLLQLLVFALGGALAGLSGVLFVSWGNFITPQVFGVTANILPVIWVAVGGRNSLLGVAIATVFLSWLNQYLAMQGNYAFVVLGAILIFTVLLLPDGVAPSLEKWWSYLWRRSRLRASRSGASPTPEAESRSCTSDVPDDGS